MRFDVEQRFPADPAAVLAAYTTPAMYESLPRFGRITLLEVVDHATDGSTVDIALRYRFSAPLPSAATAVIDPDKLTWVQRTRFDLAARNDETRLDPDHYADKMEASTASEFEADGAGTLRRVRGELKVHVPLVGSRVERVIVDGLREHLGEEARLLGAQLGGG